MFDNKDLEEKVVLFCVDLDNGEDVEVNLDELEELVKTAGATVVGRLVQKKDGIDKATYIGSGKTLELKELVEESGATGVVCDDELSPMQLKNLEEALDTKIMDRTMVILDIFAGRATTREGKIQVELAQLKYRSSRLIGMRSSLSRLGGGIGTRGPGEKKLEMDRRLIKDRIAILKKEIEDMKVHRELSRRKRSTAPGMVISIVGYTNAGKSTLLNELTGASVIEEDKLFATLDPTTRNYKLESGQEIMLTDTVGFIRKLPHHLIDAFRSTLEEAKYADILIHVVDASNPQMDKQMYTVYKTLEDLGVTDKTIITVFNKQDKVLENIKAEGGTELPVFRDFKADYTLNASIKKHEGFDTLLGYIEEIIRNRRIFISKVFEYSRAGEIQRIRKYGELIKEEYREDGIYVEAFVPIEIMPKNM